MKSNSLSTYHILLASLLAAVFSQSTLAAETGAIRFSKLTLPRTFMMTRSQDGSTILASHPEKNIISVIDSKTGKLLRTIKAPHAGILLQRGKHLYVTVAGKGSINVLSWPEGKPVNQLMCMEERIILSLSAHRQQREENYIVVGSSSPTARDKKRVAHHLLEVTQDKPYTIDSSNEINTIRDKKKQIPGKYVSSNTGIRGSTALLQAGRFRMAGRIQGPRAFWFSPITAWLTGHAKHSLSSVQCRALVPDENQDLVYRFQDDKLEVLSLNTALPVIATRAINYPPLSTTSTVGFASRSGQWSYTSFNRECEATCFPRPIAFSDDKTLYFFVRGLDGALYWFKTPAFEPKSHPARPDNSPVNQFYPLNLPRGAYRFTISRDLETLAALSNDCASFMILDPKTAKPIATRGLDANGICLLLREKTLLIGLDDGRIASAKAPDWTVTYSKPFAKNIFITNIVAPTTSKPFDPVYVIANEPNPKKLGYYIGHLWQYNPASSKTVDLTHRVDPERIKYPQMDPDNLMLGLMGKYYLLEELLDGKTTPAASMAGPYQHGGRLYPTIDGGHYVSQGCLQEGFFESKEHATRLLPNQTNFFIPCVNYSIAIHLDKKLQLTSINLEHMKISRRRTLLPVPIPEKRLSLSIYHNRPVPLSFRHKDALVIYRVSAMGRLYRCDVPLFFLDSSITAKGDVLEAFPDQWRAGKQLNVRLPKAAGKYSIVSGAKDATISSDGIFRWTPRSSARGEHNIKLRMDVPEQFPKFLLYKMEILDPKLLLASASPKPSPAGTPGIDRYEKGWQYRSSETGRIYYHYSKLRETHIFDSTGKSLGKISSRPSTQTKFRNAFAERKDYLITAEKNKLTFLDHKTYNRLKTIDLPKDGIIQEIVAHPAKKQLFVSAYYPNRHHMPRVYEIYVIDEEKGTYRGFPYGIGRCLTIDPTGRFLYVTTDVYITMGVPLHNNYVDHNHNTLLYKVMCVFDITGPTPKFEDVFTTGDKIGGNKVGRFIPSPDGKSLVRLQYRQWKTEPGTPPDVSCLDLVRANDPNKRIRRLEFKRGPKKRPLQFRSAEFHPQLDVLMILNDSQGERLKYIRPSSGRTLPPLVDEASLPKAIRSVHFTSDGKSILVEYTNIDRKTWIKAFPLKLTASQSREIASHKPAKLASQHTRKLESGLGRAVSKTSLSALTRRGSSKSLDSKEIGKQYQAGVVWIETRFGNGTGVIVGRGTSSPARTWFVL